MLPYSHRSPTSPLTRLASLTAARINGQYRPDPTGVHRYDAAGHLLTTLAEGTTPPSTPAGMKRRRGQIPT